MQYVHRPFCAKGIRHCYASVLSHTAVGSVAAITRNGRWKKAHNNIALGVVSGVIFAYGPSSGRTR